MDREASRWRASPSRSWVLDLQEPEPHSDSRGQISWKMRPIPRGPLGPPAPHPASVSLPIYAEGLLSRKVTGNMPGHPVGPA